MRRAGFSLLEMVAVIAVMAILTALVAPAVGGIMRSSSLTSSGRMLVDQLNLARQIAQSKNMPVEFRLYKIAAPGADAASSPDKFRACQIFLVGPNVSPQGKADFFKDPVVISSGNEESAFLTDIENTSSSHRELSPAANDPKLGVYGQNYRYVAFRFLPSGGTDLETGKNFLTLVLDRDKALRDGGNFFTVQIDPINGSVRSFRP